MKKLFILSLILSLALLAQSESALFSDQTTNKVFSSNKEYWLTELNKFNQKNHCGIAFAAYENTNNINADSLTKSMYLNLPAQSKPKDQGAFILFSLYPLNAYIYSGSGLEEYMPASYRKYLIQKEILPLLQDKKYETALETAVLKIMDKSLMKDRPKAGQRLKPSMFKGYHLLVFILLLLFAALMAYLTTTGTWKEIQWNREQKKIKQ